MADADLPVTDNHGALLLLFWTLLLNLHDSRGTERILGD